MDSTPSRSLSSGVSLATTGCSVIIRRQPVALGDALILGVVSLLALALLLLTFWGVSLLARECVTEPSPLLFLLMAVLIVACVPGTYAFFALQGLVFPFVVTFDADRLHYRLRNGLCRWSFAVPKQGGVIVVYPVFSRGDWGYAASLRIGESFWRWPVLPAAVLGSKSKARQEANEVQRWLSRQLEFVEVRLEKWEQPGESVDR